MQTDQKTVQLTTINEAVPIRELCWADSLDLYNRIKSQSASLTDAQGNMVLDAERLMSAIGASADAAGWLAQKATGKDDAWIAQRSLSEILDITLAAVELNFAVVVSRIGKFKGALQGVAGKTKTPVS